MKALIHSIFFLTFVASAVSFGASTTTCTQGKATRKIEVSSTDETKKVPCEVKYFKEGDEAGKVLYNAANDATYCDTKAQELAAKLTGMGWQCTGGEAAATDPATEAPKTDAPAKQ